MALYYIAYYAPSQLKDYQLTTNPAGQTKASYIVDTLEKIGHRYTVVSLSVHESKKIHFSTKTVLLGERGTFVVWPSLGQRNRILRKMSHILRKLQLVFFLNTLNENDTVIVYHSLITAEIITRMARKRKFRLILELEEIYQDVVDCSKSKAYWEREIIKNADDFILSSQGLAAETGKENSYVVANGTYKVEPSREISSDDAKVHVVYAGTLDPRKGGAAAAAAAAEFLPENYHVHVLGFGSEQQIDDMKQLTQEISQKGKATVTYDGLLSGEDYIRFIQACDIGLSTQNPDAAFNATSFPSKVLSYMANGLRVVSVRIEAIESSAVGDLITYYEEQTPECIARAIMSVDMSQPYDSRKRIAELDDQFQKDLKKLIEAK